MWINGLWIKVQHFQQYLTVRLCLWKCVNNLGSSSLVRTFHLIGSVSAQQHLALWLVRRCCASCWMSIYKDGVQATVVCGLKFCYKTGHGTIYTANMVEKFVGTWKMVSSENFDEYMKALGMWTRYTFSFTTILKSLYWCSCIRFSLQSRIDNSLKYRRKTHLSLFFYIYINLSYIFKCVIYS